MVKNVTSLTQSGVKDFFLQRISAVILGTYILYLLVFCVTAHPLTYSVWTALFSCQWMKIFTLLAIASLLIHTWIGMWTVFTDYITCAVVRGILMVGLGISVFAYLVWGIIILWG